MSKGMIARLQIGINIPTPKSINSLFGVPYHNKAALRATLSNLIDMLKDRVLHGICILKLIH